MLWIGNGSLQALTEQQEKGAGIRPNMQAFPLLPGMG